MIVRLRRTQVSVGIFTEKGLDFFSHPDNLGQFNPPNASTEALFKLLAEKSQRLSTALSGAHDEAQALLEKLKSAQQQQSQTLFDTLASSLDLEPEVVRLLVQVVYTTATESEDLSTARLMTPILAYYRQNETDETVQAEIFSSFHRLQQFALIINKTELTAQQVKVFLDKENLILHKPEKLGFPNWDHYDGLFRDASGNYYLTSADQYAKYSGQDYRLLKQEPLSQSDELKLLPDPFTQKIDTGFEDLEGNIYLFSGDKFIRWDKPHPEVQRISLHWGRVDNAITQDKRIDAAFSAQNGHFYLFRDDQYVRYSDIQQSYVDEGYPKKIKDNWNQEGQILLPSLLNQGLDAILEDQSGAGYFFLGTEYLSSRQPDQFNWIADHWGRVFNRIVAENEIDGVVMINGRLYLFRQEQYVRYSSSDYTVVDIGYPLRIWEHWSQEGLGSLPEVLQEPWVRIQAGFQGVDGKIYLFVGEQHAEHYFVLGSDNELQPIAHQWGRVRNNIERLQRIDAAIQHSGKTYLFSGDQYTVYSGALRPGADDFYVLEGYPKKIADNWNTLEHLGNLPEAFTSGLNAAFVAPEDTVYYFKGENYSSSNNAQQQLIVDHWGRVRNELEIRHVVDAAFTWQDKFYLFSGDQYFRYTQEDQEYVDEGYPKTFVAHFPSEGDWDSALPEHYGSQGLTAAFRTPEAKICLFSGNTFVISDDFSQEYPIYPSWARVRNHIQHPQEGKRHIDAAFTYDKTYMFSGDQCFCYTGNEYADYVDEGYPRKIEHVFGGLPGPFRQGIDVAFMFVGAGPRRLYLFRDNAYVRYTDMSFSQIDAGYPRAIASGSAVEGGLFTHLNVINANPEKHYTVYVNTVASKETLHLFYYLAEQNTLYYRNCQYSGGQYNWSDPMSAYAHLQQYIHWGTIDTAFYGRDGQVHYFWQEGWVARSPLDTTSPKPASATLTAKWGRIQNRFTQFQRVDAVYQAENQKVYLFCDDQFIRYSQVLNPGAEDFYVDEGYPKTIATAWPQEEDSLVVPDQFSPDTAYVLTRTPSGKRIVFTYDAYQIQDEMDTPLPLLARWGKVKNHFTQVDAAYVAENGATYLFSHDQFIRYSGAITPEAEHFYVDEGYPRTLAAAWEAEAQQLTLPSEFKPEGYALVRAYGTSYVFKDHHYWHSASAQPQALSAHWGRVRNHIQQREKLDTAAVLTLAGQQYTYLFSDDQYVRYSQGYSDYVDEGYPKTIATHWATESGFALPSDYQNQLQGLFQDDNGKFYAFMNQSFITSEVAEPRAIQAHWGIVRNLIQTEQRVDAAYYHEGKTYLFRGDQYVRYSGSLNVTADDFYVDESYPRPLEQFGMVEGSFSLPDKFHQGVDAAFSDPQGAIYFLKDNYSFNSNAPDVVEALEARWGQVYNQFTSGERIDAAFQGLDGQYYLFYQEQYICYDSLDQLGSDAFYVTEGYPKKIGDNLGQHWPADFHEDIDAAWVFEGRTYLFKGDQYLRFSDPLCRFPDELAALGAINVAWQDRPLLLLRDVVKIDQFKILTDTYNRDEYPLLRYFEEQDYHLEQLSRATGWDVAELKNMSLPEIVGQNVALDNLSGLMRLKQIMDYGAKLGSKASTIKDEIWNKLFSQNLNYLEASQLLIGLLKAKHSEQDWAILAQELHNNMNLAKRNALLPYLMHLLGFSTSRALYAELLMDMEMSECATTSRIKNAILTTQLFYHRTLINLEVWEEGIKTQLEDLKKWWGWLKNYRVWEANRKVFLYPENYIRPELRSNKSPAFQKLEEELLQTDITDVAVEKAYKNYLDEYAVVSSLVIAGGYLYLKEDNETPTTDEEKTTETYAIMFGFSRTQPLKYYYRIGKVGEQVSTTVEEEVNTSIDWAPWLELGIQINAERVYPVYAFNRIFVFWVELKEINETEFSATMEEPISSKNTKLSYEPVIYYSFYNLNQTWITPQTLVSLAKNISKKENEKIEELAKEALGIDEDETVPEDREEEFANKVSEISQYFEISREKAIFDDARLMVTNPSRSSDYDKEERIYIIYQFTARWITNNEAFQEQASEEQEVTFSGQLTSELNYESERYNSGMEDTLNARARFPYFGFSPSAYINWGIYFKDTISAPWFSFDIKGGSFLCKPNKLSNVSSKDIKKFDADDSPFKEHVDAGLKVDAGFKVDETTSYIFSGEQYYIFDGNQLHSPELITNRWGKLNLFAMTNEKLLHAFVLGNKTHFITNSSYFSYSQSNYTHYEDIKPKPRSHFSLSPLLTSFQEVTWNSFWGSKSATNAFIFNGNLYLFAGQSYCVTPVSELAHSTSLGTLDAAVIDNGKLYVTGGNNFVTFNGSGWSSISALQQGHLWGNYISRIVAGFKGLDGKYYFFDGEHYVSSDNYQLQPLSKKWGQAKNILAQGVDAAVIDGTGYLYLFKGQYYLAYEHSEAPYPDHNQPLSIEDNWQFSRVEAGFYYKNEKIYLFGKRNGERQYSRYSAHTQANASYSRDSGYPKKFKGSWGNLISYYNTQLQAGFYQGHDFYLFSTNKGVEKTYVKYNAGEEDTSWPYELNENEIKYKIIRLTSNTGQKLSQKLFAKGVSGLLTLETQETDELPKFVKYDRDEDKDEDKDEKIEDPYISHYVQYYLQVYRNIGIIVDPLHIANSFSLDTIYYQSTRLDGDPPDSKQLDFESANGSYYWEIFFHTPYLIAQTLNTAQRFEEAQKWYQYIYDPMEPGTKENPTYWKFLPFFEEAQEEAEEKAPQKKKPYRDKTQLDKYRDDPFDPHGIARLRPIAYRKALVMSYIDNLLDWGDLLFQQYTRETINEARMLYILAYDLLGKRPENLGVKKLEPAQNYRQIYADFYPGSGTDNSAAFAMLLELENDPANATIPEISTTANDETPHDDFVALGYFFIPENELFIKYWDRVEDRLHKIRHCLNIEGIKQPLALFEPPLDPMALVQAAAGGGLSRALADFNVNVPHYRFNFMLAKVREFTGRVIQLGSTLLNTLEKKDAEELGLLRNTQEKSILTMSLEIKEKQLENVKTSLASLQASLNSAQERQNHYQKLLDEGLSTYEEVQVAMMAYSKVFSITAQILGAASSVASLVPNTGSPCAMTYGGREVGASLERATGVLNALAGTFDFASNLSATLGGWDRRAQDWQLQQKLASHDIQQINHQIAGTQIQIQIAQKEIEVQKRQIKHNEDIDTFMHSKFTNKQLYQWMASKLAGIYFQTYQMALDLAKGLQRAFQFELGLKESEVNFITSVYWDSLHKGLLAGEQLQKDLDRMEKAYLEKNHRRFEISKTVALSQIAPLALLRLKQKRDCEFTLTESLFDYDFPGHYCRQIKTISISFPAVVGQYQNLNATLTQLAHHTLIEPDKDGVSYLLQPQSGVNYLLQEIERDDVLPNSPSIRSDWRAQQQIALSRGENDSGLFQLNFQDERYLPFEGTGAVSTWRLEFSGIEGLIDFSRLQDVIIQLNYTALAGGESFANEVKKQLPATERARLFLLKQNFSEAWQQFMQSPADGISFQISSEQLPHIDNNNIQGVYLQYSLTEEGESLSKVGMNLSIGEKPVMAKGSKPRDEPFEFKHLSYVKEEEVKGLKIGNQYWKLKPSTKPKPITPDDFNPENLRDIALVVVYIAKAR